MAAGQAADGLIHHRLEDGRCQIFHPGAVINQRLNIRLGEHTAPGCDRIDDLIILRRLIQSVGVCIQQDSHLIDERTGAPCTGSVHSLFNRLAVERDFRILSPQLDDTVCLGNQRFHRLRTGNDLLFEPDAHQLRKGQTAGPGDHRLNRHISHFPVQILHQFLYLVENVRHMTFIS